MKYLLNTHVMLWFLENADELSARAKRILISSENVLYWSVASYWELTVKISLGKLKLRQDWEDILYSEKRSNRIQDLPIHESP